ncbi:MAG: 30S ribosomal protein S2 [Patescibacteria group bacterium]|nr:30S ribosomal protein S2 [Patescibacteria group bacterium]
MSKDQTQIIEEMFRAGCHYGYSKSKRHASITPQIFTTKNGVDIINIEKTYEQLENTLEEIKNAVQAGKTIMFVGTKAEASKQINETATSLGVPYVSERWVGGTITNFSEIKKRVAKLLDLREQKEKGDFEKYTKKERLMLAREMEDMTKNFQGIVNMTKRPDYLLIIDPKKEHIAVTEAIKMNIPIIAILNTDCNAKEINFPIIANDASVSSISFFISKIEEIFKQNV